MLKEANSPNHHKLCPLQLHEELPFSVPCKQEFPYSDNPGDCISRGIPPCQHPNHQPPPFKPGGCWQTTPLPHLMSFTAPSAGGDTPSHKTCSHPNRQSMPFKPGYCWQSSPLFHQTSLTAPSAVGDNPSCRSRQCIYHQSSLCKPEDY